MSKIIISADKSVFRLNQTEPVRAERQSRKSQFTSYSKLVVPVSMRSIYWQFFGFPATVEGEIITRTRIVCILCRGQIAYNRNTSNLRMHLQNKHLKELSQIEANATPKARKSKVVRTSVKMEQEEGEEEATAEEYYTDMDAMPEAQAIVLERSDDAMGAIYYTEEEKKTPVKSVRPSRSYDIVTIIKNYILLDLESPHIVNGRGFQRLLLNIENPCSVPSKPMLETEIIPKQYAITKSKLLQELSTINGQLGVTIEEWQCADAMWYATICVYYLKPDCEVACKNLSTIAFLPEMTNAHWESMIAQVFEEWNICAEKTTAVVCPMERTPLVTALHNMGYSTVPCLHHTIQECVRQCFSHEVISEIIGKVRRHVTLLKNNPLTAKNVEEYIIEKGVETGLILDVEGVWLTTLEMLESFIPWKEGTQKILDFVIGPPLSTSLKIGDDEWDIIADLVSVLQPLKMTLMSVSEEQVASISLLRPMLWQVIEHKLNETVDESVTSTNLKSALVEVLNFRYLADSISPLLDLATILDPRFKILPHYTEAEKNKMEETVLEAVRSVLNDFNEDVTDAEDEQVGFKKRLSSMEMLLGELKPKKMKVDIDTAIKLEYQTYLTYTNIQLDVNPLEWWQKNRTKFPRLSQLADKYTFIPPVTVLPDKRTAEAFLEFHAKRSTLSADMINQLIFLHVNYSVP